MGFLLIAIEEVERSIRMLRFEFLLWIFFMRSAVCGWQETVFSVTSDDCVESIARLTESYDALMNSSDGSVTKELQEKLASVFQEAKKQLTGLLPLARGQLSFDAFPHEIRILRSLPVYCPRELSLTVAEICNNASQKSAGLVFQERLSTKPLGNLEPQTTTIQQGPDQHEQPFSRVNRPAHSTHKHCYRYLKSNGKIMKALAGIDSNIAAMGAEVREIASMLAEQSADYEIEGKTSQLLKDYPLETQVALAKVEHRLSTDHSYKSNLVNNLTIYGASDVRSNVVILLKKIMSNSVAANYALYGGPGKEHFEKLGLYNVISRVVWHQFGKSHAVELEMNHSIKAWLRRAPLRLAREHRKNAAHYNGNDFEIMAVDEVETIDDTDDRKTINYNN